MTGLLQETESAAEAETLIAGVAAFDFDVLYNTSTAHESIAAAFATSVEELTAVGTVSLVNQDWPAYLDSRDAFDYDVARGGWKLDSNNVLNYLETLIAQSGYTDTTIDDLIADAQSALDNSDLAGHVDALKMLHDHILDVMVVLPVYYY